MERVESDPGVYKLIKVNTNDYFKRSRLTTAHHDKWCQAKFTADQLIQYISQCLAYNKGQMSAYTPCQDAESNAFCLYNSFGNMLQCHCIVHMLSRITGHRRHKSHQRIGNVFSTHKTVVDCSMLAKHKQNKIQPFLQRVAPNGRAQKDKGKLGHMGYHTTQRSSFLAPGKAHRCIYISTEIWAGALQSLTS